MPQKQGKKKITISQLKKYLPIKPPDCPMKLPQLISRYLMSPGFSNLSIKQQNLIKAKYDSVYRNYYAIQDIVNYLSQVTEGRYTDNSIRRAICNSSQKYGVINWYKFLRIAMSSTEETKKQDIRVDKIVLINKVKQIFKNYLKKRKIWRGVEEVQQTKRALDQKVLDQLKKQTVKEVKQFIQRNRVQCETILYQAQKQHPKYINFIILEKIVNQGLQMYMDRKKAIYLYLYFDQTNRGFFKTPSLMDELLVIKKPKPVKKQTYYLLDFQQLLNRIRADFHSLFYSAHDLQNDFDEYYNKKIEQKKQKGQKIPDLDQLDPDIFYQYVSQKCERSYSRYYIDKVHKSLGFKSNIQYLYNKPNLIDLNKSVTKLLQKNKKKRILKQQNQVFYSYRTLILNLISRCKSSKLTRAKLAQFAVDIDPTLMYKSFYCVWRAYPAIINVDRIRKQCKLNPLACYLKLRRTEEQYEKIFEQMLEMMPQDTIVTYSKLEQIININLQFVLDATKIKPLQMDKYDEINYHQAIKKIFQPDFQLDIRSYIHRKVSQKAYALWVGYKARKKIKQRAQKLTRLMIKDLVPLPKVSIDQISKVRSIKSKSSARSKQQIAINAQSLQIVKWNIDKLIAELNLSFSNKTKKQFHIDEHTRNHLCINKRQQYQYRTIIPRFVMHPIPGLIGIGQNLMFLNKSRQQTIKIKFFFKPGIQIIDFTTLDNDVVILTSYFTLQFYSLAQESNYSYQTILLLDQVRNINFNDLDSICEDRSYSRFPIFIRNTGKNIFVNTALINNQIVVVSTQTNTIIKRIKFNQKQHVLNPSSIQIFKFFQKSPRKGQLYSQLIKQFNKQEISVSSVTKLLLNEVDQMENDGKYEEQLAKFRLNPANVKDFVRNMENYPLSLAICIIKQQLDLLKQRKIPQSLREVINQLIDQMIVQNISLVSVLSTIDKQNDGYIKMKSLKDYLQKIAFKVYKDYEKQIDVTFKNMAISKHVDYDIFCQIMSAWKFKIWEKPQLILRDFINVSDSNLLIYTLQTDSNVYVKNIEDDMVIAILKGHNCPPSIYFIPERYILITGDNDSIRIWRIYEDLINKYDQNPPWEVQPFSLISNAHDALITSIVYLTRAHHIVTTSLDSTTKFWRIIFKKDQLILEEVKRFYSNQWVYLSSKSNNILLDHDGSRLELVALAKVSKQVNENNKYKYQIKIQVFQVQNTIIKTGPKNIHLELPPKLKNMLQLYVDDIGVKKKILLAKTVGQIQNQTMKNNLISQNLQRTLYQSVKNCFIFEQYTQIYNISQYLSRKNISLQIVRVLFQKFGVGIPQANTQAPLNKKFNDLIRPEYADIISEYFIELSEDQIQLFCNKLKSSATNKVLSFQQAISIGSGFLDIVNFQKFQNILQEYLNKKQVKQIQIEKIISIFRPLKLDSQLDRLYAILRTINILIRQRGIQIWNIFTSNKILLEKKKKISQNQFQKFMQSLGVSQQKIKLLVIYLVKSKSISIDDYIYYTKLAWEVVGYEMNQSNFSKIFMKNSRFLKSKLENLKLDSGIQINSPLMQDKILSLQSSIAMNKSKQSLGSRKSSKKQLRQIQLISESNSAQKSSTIKQKKNSPNKAIQDGGGYSKPISSSNSRLSLSNQSNIKDQYTKQIRVIVKKIKELLKNEGKTIWDITSLSVLEFMENSLITESEYFNMLSLIRTPIRLNEKLKLMAFIMKESNQFNHISLNVLFQLFDSSQASTRISGRNPVLQIIPGQKYIISHFMSKLSQNNLILQHCLSTFFFDQKEQLTIEQIINILAQKPFEMLLFCLREFQSMLCLQNKSTFNLQEIKSIIEQRIKKYNIKVQSKQITLIEEILHQIQNKGYKLQQLIPKSKTNNGVINYSTFCNIISSFYKQKQVLLQNQFIKIVLYVQQQKKKTEKGNDSPPKLSKIRGSPKKITRLTKQSNQQKMLKNSTIKYKQLTNYINKMIDQMRNSQSNEKDGVKKFLKALQNKKLSLLMFFVSLDRNRNYFINQIQFEAGLAQLKVNQNFWPSIQKKFPKKMHYFQLINYLVQNQFVNYKCVDSELQAAVTKFIRRFIRNSDIQQVYDRLRAKDSNQSYNATFTSFQNALKMGNLFSEKQAFLIFSAFANAQNLKSSSLSNDTIIKDPTNIHKTFNFKNFTDVINNYKNQNITKTPHYKFCHFFKKRGISLLNQFIKWMDRNKKNKQIAEAVKLKQYTLSRQLYTGFIKQLGVQLQQKQIKQLLSSFPNQLEFSNFNQKLQQMYKKGNSNIETEQITAYLQSIYKTIKKLNVTTHRLFLDFTEDGFKMDINAFTELIKFLELGFTKIQNKLIFSFIDLEKKGYITFNQLQYALEDAGETIDKEEDEFQLEFIIEKLLTNKDKYTLKSSRITYNVDRAFIIFGNVLTRQQIVLLNKSAMEHFKLNDLTEKYIQQFIIDKQKQTKAKKDKKYKQLVLNFLKYLKKANIQSTQAYYYFCKDTGQLTKNKFLLSYQSLGLKATILQINSLYSYLDQGKTGVITLQKWQDKLNIIQYEKQNLQGISGQQLQVFYKVKLVLADIYLIFIRKLFKPKQIAAYFDVNGTGKITYQQLLTSFSELGMHLEQNIEGKLTNYLDKQRSGQILVNNIVYQLENCLSSKAKLILQTKTSCIFKQKIYLIQQKQSYFIQKLVNSQHFLQHNQKIQSCILITDFVDVIKDFGIMLGEDQFSDVQRNFKFNKENLLLYPLYFMFINIFKSYDNYLSTDEIERTRYQKLFNMIIKSGLNMKVFEKIQTIKQASVFLSQLKIYTPIQVKLVIQSVTVPGSNLIDSQLLIRKTRDSFLKAGQWFKASLIGQFGCDRTIMMKQWLKQQISPQKVIGILKANSGRIYKDTFQSLLIKMGIVLKKSDVLELYKIYSKGEDFVLIQNLLEENQKSQDQINTNHSYQNNYNFVLLDHICKSIDFKGVSLQQAWQKYFSNYGFISEESFYLFLNQIGFNYKQKSYEKVVPQFLQKFKQQTKFDQIKASHVQYIMKKQGIIPQKLCQQQKYMIQSQTIERLSQTIHQSSEFIEQLQLYAQGQGVNINRIPASVIYGYLRGFVKNLKHLPKNQIRQKQILFYTNLLVNKSQLNIQQFQRKLKAFIRKFYRKKRLISEMNEKQQEGLLIHVPSSSSIEKITNKRLKTEGLSSDQTIKRICQQNFMFSYKKLVEDFQTKINNLSVPSSNNYRLSLNLLVENLLENDYLLYIKPKLTTDLIIPPSQKNKKLTFQQNNHNFNLKAVPNLIIDKQQYKPQKGIYIINQKYYGMSVSEKKDFQSFAFISNLLDKEIIFLRVKNYYLWEPNDSPMPKQAINFRWKYIPICFLKICKQIQLLQQHGCAVPHLRWQNINSRLGITKIPFPSYADPMGRIQSINHQNLLKIDDPYCAPELFRKKNTTTLKLNTWVFGCIMYQFIWGHSPHSFILLLLQYIQSRHSQFKLTQVLKMEQLPSDFRYLPFKFNQIKECLSFQHEIKGQGIPDDLQNNIIYFGLRGLVKTLQTLYGNQQMYYRKQFQLLQKLHQIIIDCLDLNPDTRPTIKMILHRLSELLDEEDYRDFIYNEYIQSIIEHESVCKLNKQLIDQLKTAFFKSDSSSIQNISTRFHEKLVKISNDTSLKQIYLIPKRYPWPDQSSTQVYDQQLLINRTAIRSHSAYSSICSIQNQNCLQMLINLYVEYVKKPTYSKDSSEVIFSNILKCITIIIQMLRTYESPFAGYVSQILQAFIQLYYKQPFYFTSDTSKDQLKSGKSGLIIIRNNGMQQKRALNMIRNIIYMNGSANIEYLPIYHFMLSNRHYQLLFQYFYSSVDLISGQAYQNVDKRLLAISYFRDRMFDDYYWEIIKYLKIDLLMLNLIDSQDLKIPILMFFKDMTSSQKCLEFNLINSNIFYLKLGYILIQNLIPVLQKSLVIQIASNILTLNNSKVIKRMNQPSFGIMRQIFKLIVEPPRDTPAHQQFIDLIIVLEQFVQAFKNLPSFESELKKIEGGQTILQSFENLNEKMIQSVVIE